MSSVKQYKRKFNEKGSWQIEEPVGEYEGRTLWKVTIGEMQIGDNKKMLELEIYEDILDLMVDGTKDFIIDTGTRIQQTTFVYGSELLEYNPRKTEQYRLLREELKKRKYSFKKKVLAYVDLNYCHYFGKTPSAATQDFIGTVNGNLQESHRYLVFRHILFEELMCHIKKIYHITGNKDEFSQYIHQVSKEELAELLNYCALIRCNIKIEDAEIRDLMNEFKLSKKDFVKLVEQELTYRFYTGKHFL